MSAYAVEIIVQSCIAIITVVSVFLLTGLAGMLSFGQAMYMAVGAYVTFILANSLKLPILVTAFISILASALLALIVAISTLKLRKDYFSLVSVAVCQAFTALIVSMKSITNGALGYSRIPKVKSLLWLALGITVLIILFARNYKYSRFGRMCIALKNDELAARSFGIRTFALKTKTYILSSMMGAVAGILFAMQSRFLEPGAFGWTKSSEMIIFLFFGGTNSLTGSVISGGVLRALPELLRGVKLFGHSMQDYRTIIYCLLILLILNFRPSGLFGDKELSFQWLRKLLVRRKEKRNE